MTEPPPMPVVPPEPELRLERQREDRSERWLLVRQGAIMLALAALLLHSLVIR